VPNPVRIKLIEPLVTIDYEKFCRTMLPNSNRFRLAEVRAVEGDKVMTNAGDFQSGCLVDCTGWRAVLANCIRPALASGQTLAFGIESEIGYTDDEIHFIFDHSLLPDGYAWIFPAGRRSRIGVGTFNGRTRLYPDLSRLLARFGLGVGPIHGGYIPFVPRPATVDHIFVVGDSAGHPIPFTLEGIRRSIWNGMICGRLVNEIVQGRMRLEDGLRKYRIAAERSRLAYRFLAVLQRQYVRDGGSSLRLIMKLFLAPTLGPMLQKSYFLI